MSTSRRRGGKAAYPTRQSVAAPPNPRDLLIHPPRTIESGPRPDSADASSDLLLSSSAPSRLPRTSPHACPVAGPPRVGRGGHPRPGATPKKRRANPAGGGAPPPPPAARRPAGTGGGRESKTLQPPHPQNSHSA